MIRWRMRSVAIRSMDSRCCVCVCLPLFVARACVPPPRRCSVVHPIDLLVRLLLLLSSAAAAVVLFSVVDCSIRSPLLLRHLRSALSALSRCCCRSFGSAAAACVQVGVDPVRRLVVQPEARSHEVRRRGLHVRGRVRVGVPEGRGAHHRLSQGGQLRHVPRNGRKVGQAGRVLSVEGEPAGKVKRAQAKPTANPLLWGHLRSSRHLSFAVFFSLSPRPSLPLSLAHKTIMHTRRSRKARQTKATSKMLQCRTVRISRIFDGLLPAEQRSDQDADACGWLMIDARIHSMASATCE